LVPNGRIHLTVKSSRASCGDCQDACGKCAELNPPCSEHLYALPQDHGKLVIKILEIRPRGPVHRGRFLVAVPADFTAIPPGDTVEPPGKPHRQRVTFRAG
jgi:hypothetical protein